MQKKILASLLMVPMAYSAFANIEVPVDGNDWTVNGLAGAGFKFDEATNTVQTASVATGNISQTIKDLPKGKYVLSFASFTNIAVKVQINGAAATDATLEDNKFEFNLPDGGDVTLFVEAADQTQTFKFQSLTLEIDCDFDAIQEELTATLLDKLYGDGKIKDVIPAAVEAKFKNAVELNNETATLKNQVDYNDSPKAGTIRAMIREIRKGIKEDNTEYSAETALKIYKDYQLWLGAEDCTVGVAMNELIDKVTAHNEAVDQLNASWNYYVTNTQAKADLLGGISDLQKQLDALKDAIKAAAEKPAYGKYGKYITDVTAEDVAAIQAAIDAEEGRINEAYADDKLDAEINFTSNSQAIVDSLAALDTKYKAADADVNAYAQWLNATRDFLSTYNVGDKTVTALRGIEGYEDKYKDNFEPLKAEVKEQISTIYNNAVAAFKIQEVRFDENGNIISGNISEAAENLAADKDTMAAATEQINAAVANLVELVNTQNTLMSSDLNEVATTVGELKSLTDLLAKYNGKLPDPAASDLNKGAAECQAAIDALLAALDETYAAYELQLEDFETLAADAAEKVATFKALAQPVIDLLEAYNAAVADLEKNYGANSKNGKAIYGSQLLDKFATAEQNILDAIGAMPVYDEDGNPVTIDENYNKSVADITAAIDELKTNAANLDDAWVKAYNAKAGYEALVKGLDDLFANKLLLDESIRAALEKGITDLQGYKDSTAAFNKLVADYEAACAEANGQKCYEMMLAINAGITLDKLTSNYNAWMKMFDTNGTGGTNYHSNRAVVKEDLDAIRTYATGEYAGKTDVIAAIDGFQTEYNTLKGEYDTLKEATTYTHKSFNDLDLKYQALQKKINDLKTTIDYYKDLQAIYDKFVVDLGKLQDAIDADTKYNAENATPDANAHWTDEIAKMQKAKDDLKAAVDAAHDAYADETKDLNAVKEDLQKKYDDQLAAANGLPALIEANEVANVFLLNHSNVIRTAINTEIDNLKAKIETANAAGNTDLAEELEGWIKELDNLLINNGCSFIGEDGTEIFIDLATVDMAEKDAFNNGQAATKMDSLLQQYEAINSKFQVLKTLYDNHYADELSAWNHRFDGTWAASLDELLDSYKAAITTYDQYMYGLKHPGYKAFIASALEDHRNIYKYIDKINALEDEVTKYIKDKTEAGELISNLDYTTNVAAKQFELNSAINDEVALMEAQVEALAEKYYEEHYTEAKESIDMATTKLTQAGVSDEIASEALAAYNNELAKAVDAEDDAKENEKVSYGIAMDAIAGYLDNATVPATFDYDAVAQTEWTADLFAADATIADLEAEIEAAEFATDAVKDAEMAKFNEAKAAIAELKAAPYSPAELDTLLGLQDALKEALDKAQAATDAIKADSAANKANQDAYKNLTAVISDYEDQLAALTQFVNGLVAGEASTLVAPTAAVEALKDFVEDNKASLIDKTTEIDNLKAAIDAAIKAAYGTTVTDENNLLDEWIGRLKAAYNDAKVNAGIETFDADYAEVKAFIDANSTATGVNLPAYSDPSFNKADYTEAATEIEFNIAQYYNELQKLWTSDKNGNDNPNANPYQDALDKVNAVFDETSKDMQDAYAELLAAEELKTVNEEAYNAFEEAYQAINEEMEQIQGRFTGEGVRIIFNWEEFVSELADMSAKIAGLAAQVDEAQAAAAETYKAWQASDAKAAELQGTIDDLTTHLDALKAKVAEYDINDTAINGQIADIENDIETAQKNLDADKADHKLTATSVLNPDDAGISSAIFNTGVEAAKVYANQGVTEAKAASTELSKELQKNVVPEIASALRTEQLQLKADLEAVQNAINAVDLNDLDTTAATFEALHDQAATIKARLEEMLSEATENIFVLGDVDGDEDGLVTAADVQLLIQWVGEGKTYEDLYAMSPVVAAAANVAQEPGQAPAINIADITAEIKLVMNADYDTPNAAKFVQRRAAAQGTISAVALGGNRYAIALNTTQAFVAGQLDIVLPAGAQIVNAELVGMSHQLYQFNNDGYTRMIVASMNNEELKGDQLLIIEVEGNGAPEVDNALFTDSEANTYTLGNGTVTGIEGIEAENGMVQRIYNAAGQAMRTIKRGINIIRHSDGTTTKELHK